MSRFRSALLALSASVALAAPAAAVADEGVDVGKTKRVVVTGTVLDAKTREPIPEAQVEIDGGFGTKRGVTGPDGRFAVTATADAGLGELSVAIDHATHQQKYLETQVRDAFPGDVTVRVESGGAHVKMKKTELDLACDESGDVPTKAHDTAPFRGVCDGTRKGVELTLRGTTVAFLATGPFTLEIRSGRFELRDSANDDLEIRVTAAMLPR